MVLLLSFVALLFNLFKVEFLKQPRLVRYKKLNRGNFKVIKFYYNKNCILTHKNVFAFISQGSGFYNWKNVTNLQRRIGQILKKKKQYRFHFNFSLCWNFSYKTHKSRMGKGKGTVSIDDWCSRIQSGKCLIFLRSRRPLALSVQRRLNKVALVLPVRLSLLRLL